MAPTRVKMVSHDTICPPGSIIVKCFLPEKVIIFSMPTHAYARELVLAFPIIPGVQRSSLRLMINNRTKGLRLWDTPASLGYTEGSEMMVEVFYRPRASQVQACDLGVPDFLQTAVDRGDKDTLLKSDMSPGLMVRAAVINSVDMLEFLYSHGCVPYDDGPFWWAACCDSLDAVKWLHERQLHSDYPFDPVALVIGRAGGKAVSKWCSTEGPEFYHRNRPITRFEVTLPVAYVPSAYPMTIITEWDEADIDIVGDTCTVRIIGEPQWTAEDARRLVIRELKPISNGAEIMSVTRVA